MQLVVKSESLGTGRVLASCLLALLGRESLASSPKQGEVDAFRAASVAWTFARRLGMPVDERDINAFRQGEVFVVKFAEPHPEQPIPNWEKSIVVEVAASSGRVQKAENLTKPGAESPMRFGQSRDIMAAVGRLDEAVWLPGIGFVPGWKGVPFSPAAMEAKTEIRGVGRTVTYFHGPPSMPSLPPRPSRVSQADAERLALNSIQRLVAKDDLPLVLSSEMILGLEPSQDRLCSLWKVVVRSSWPGYSLDEDVFVDAATGKLVHKDIVKSASFPTVFAASRSDDADIAGFLKVHQALSRARRRMQDFILMNRPIESFYWNGGNGRFRREDAVIYSSGGAVCCSAKGDIYFAYSQDSPKRNVGRPLEEAELVKKVAPYVRKEAGKLPPGRFIVRPAAQKGTNRVIYQEIREGRFSLAMPVYAVSVTSDGIILGVQRGTVLTAKVKQPDAILADGDLVNALVKAFREAKAEGGFGSQVMQMPAPGAFEVREVRLGPLGWENTWSLEAHLSRYAEVRGILAKPEGPSEEVYRVNVSVGSGLPMWASLFHLSSDDVPLRPDELGQPYIISGDQIRPPTVQP